MPKHTVEAQREYQRLWIKARRAAWIESQGGACVECGSRESLEVDHIERSTKSMNPAWLWSRRESVRIEELAKCQLLCNPCHLAKTVAENAILNPIAGHGNNARYTGNLRCRCELCRQAHAVYARRWRSAARV